MKKIKKPKPKRKVKKPVVKDKVAKGRQAKGMPMGPIKLTPAQVQAIRAEQGTPRLVGLKYGIGRSQVTRIRRGEAWQHLSTK